MSRRRKKSSNNKEKNYKIGECEYHLCDKKGKVYKCEYCGKYFCEEHLRSKPPGMPRFGGTSTEDALLMEEWRRPDGHPCPRFYEFWREEQQKKEKIYAEALKEVVESSVSLSSSEKERKIESSVTYLPTPPPTTYKPETIKKKYSSKKKIIIPIILVAFLALFFYLYNSFNIFKSYKTISPLPMTNKNESSSLSTTNQTKTSSENISRNTSNEPKYITLCKKSLEEIMKREQIKAPVEFSYRIIEIREFSSPKEALIYKKNYASSIYFSSIFTPKTEPKFCEDNPPANKIIGILVEVRFSQIIDYFGVPVEKFSDVFFCNEYGMELKLC